MKRVKLVFETTKRVFELDVFEGASICFANFIANMIFALIAYNFLPKKP